MIKLVLLKDFAKLGKAGDLISVKEGYAHNFLLPQKIAVYPNARVVKEMQGQKQAAQQKSKAEQEEFSGKIKKLDGETITIQVRINAKGNFYQKIDQKDIAKKLGVDPASVEKIQLKKIGDYRIKIGHGQTKAEVIVKIVAEK